MRHSAGQLSELLRVLAALLCLHQGGHCQLLLETTARLLFSQQGLLAALQDPATVKVVLASEPAAVTDLPGLAASCRAPGAAGDIVFTRSIWPSAGVYLNSRVILITSCEFVTHSDSGRLAAADPMLILASVPCSLPAQKCLSGFPATVICSLNGS